MVYGEVSVTTCRWPRVTSTRTVVPSGPGCAIGATHVETPAGASQNVFDDPIFKVTKAGALRTISASTASRPGVLPCSQTCQRCLLSIRRRANQLSAVGQEHSVHRDRRRPPPLEVGSVVRENVKQCAAVPDTRSDSRILGIIIPGDNVDPVGFSVNRDFPCIPEIGCVLSLVVNLVSRPVILHRHRLHRYFRLPMNVANEVNRESINRVAGWISSAPIGYPVDNGGELPDVVITRIEKYRHQSDVDLVRNAHCRNKIPPPRHRTILS